MLSGNDKLRSEMLSGNHKLRGEMQSAMAELRGDNRSMQRNMLFGFLSLAGIIIGGFQFS